MHTYTQMRHITVRSETTSTTFAKAQTELAEHKAKLVTYERALVDLRYDHLYTYTCVHICEAKLVNFERSIVDLRYVCLYTYIQKYVHTNKSKLELPVTSAAASKFRQQMHTNHTRVRIQVY